MLVIKNCILSLKNNILVFISDLATFFIVLKIYNWRYKYTDTNRINLKKSYSI